MYRFLYFLQLLGCYVLSTYGAPRITPAGLKYLQSYGYYKVPKAGGAVSTLQTQEQIKNSIRSLQRFAGIPETGALDDSTIKLMETPRCGMSDYSETSSTKKRKRRYTLQGSQWHNKDTLTWRLQNDNNDGLTKEQVERVMHQAFSKWSQVTNMNFVKLDRNHQGQADIEVKFVTGYHNDPYPFDGPGNTLAHAFYPHNNEGLSGDVHFDDDEVFVLDQSGRNLLWVATHEIGHSLGLEHSNVQAAIMYPWYKRFDGSDFDLNDDDIIGIQNIYGSRRGPKPTNPEPITLATTKKTTTTTESTHSPGCTGVIKAVFLDKDTKNTYIVNDDKVYTLDSMLRLQSGGPKALKEFFPLADRADAIYTNYWDRITIFKDTKYYLYESVDLDRPNLLNEGSIYDRFQGLPRTVKRIDAAFNWKRNRKTYLFVGNEYYRYDESYRSIDPNYPRKIKSAWNGIPDNLDAVFEWRNGVTYFFKDGGYYRLNNEYVRTEKHYPRSISQIWTRCANVGQLNNFASTLHHSQATILFTIVTVLIAKYLF